MRWSLLVVAALAGCSLTYDWEPDETQPCRADNSCDDGFSCLRTQQGQRVCVRLESQLQGEECSDDNQCADDNHCVDGFCRRACDRFYEAGECPTNFFCKKFAGFEDGYCVESQCATTAPDACGGNGQICVRIKPSAGACLPACQIIWTGDTYADNCGSSGTNPRYCQPLGESRYQRLVCLDSTPPLQSLESSCADVGSNACEKKLYCMDDNCREYCPPRPNGMLAPTDCPASRQLNNANLCCLQTGGQTETGATETWGYCFNSTTETCVQ